MHKEIPGKLDRCKAKLNATRTLIGKYGGESKSKAVYITGCALILYYFALDHIPTSGIDLISLVRPRML